YASRPRQDGGPRWLPNVECVTLPITAARRSSPVPRMPRDAAVVAVHAARHDFAINSAASHLLGFNDFQLCRRVGAVHDHPVDAAVEHVAPVADVRERDRASARINYCLDATIGETGGDACNHIPDLGFAFAERLARPEPCLTNH